MKTYILFIFGMFEDHEDIDYFCDEILSTCKSIKEIRYIVENSQNLIVIFDSDLDYKTMSEDLFTYLVNDNIKLYFMFERDTIVTAHLPQKLKDFIFKPINEENRIRLDFRKDLDLDELLDKIEEMGLESLTPEEKNFLDNFENS